MVVIGVLIIYPLGRAATCRSITATIKRVAEGAENVEVPHTDRADEIGALARAIQIFQEAMDRNRNLNSQVLQDSKARETRAGHIEASVEAVPSGDRRRAARGHRQCESAMRDTAQTICQAWHRMQADAPSPPPARPSRLPATSTRVASAAEELSASVEEIGRQVRQSAGVVEQAGHADRKIDHRDRKSRRGDPAHRRRAQL